MIWVTHNTSGIFYMYVFVNAGSIYETPKQAGISHVIEHMLFKQTKHMSNKDILEESTRVGGVFNATTDSDVTYYYFKTITEHYAKTIRIMSEILNNPVFNKNDFDSEKKVILEELSKGMDNSDRSLWRLSTLSVIPSESPYEAKVIGSRDTITSLTTNDLHRYYNDMYKNFVVVLNCERKIEADAKHLISRLFGSKLLSASLVRELTVPVIPTESESKVIVLNDHANQNNFVLTFPLFERNLPLKKVLLLEFLSFVLANSGLYALLNYRLREQKGLVYTVSAMSENLKYMTFFRIFLSSSSSDTEEILSTIGKTLKSLQKNGISKEDFRVFKAGFITSMFTSFVSEAYKTLVLGTQVFNTNGREHVTDKLVESTLKSFSNNDLIDISREVLKRQDMGLVCVGNFPHAQDSSESFLSYIDKYFK